MWIIFNKAKIPPKNEQNFHIFVRDTCRIDLIKIKTTQSVIKMFA